MLSNALKYTRSGSVSITLEAPKTLCIRDTGIGIAPEDRERIFERFVKLDTFTQGTGLGLSICKSIAEAHLATLAFSARTARDGGGLAVTLTMPARSEAPLHENYGNLP